MLVKLQSWTACIPASSSLLEGLLQEGCTAPSNAAQASGSVLLLLQAGNCTAGDKVHCG